MGSPKKHDRITTKIDSIKSEMLRSFLLAVYNNDVMTPTSVEESAKIIVDMEVKLAQAIEPHTEIIEDEDCLDSGIELF